MKFWVKSSPSESTCSLGSTFSKFRNFRGWDLGAEHADWLSSRGNFISTIVFLKSVAVRAVRVVCYLNQQWSLKNTTEVQTLLNLYAEEEIQRELESHEQYYVTGVSSQYFRPLWKRS